LDRLEERQQQQQFAAKLAKVKTLGEDDSVDDAASWVNKMYAFYKLTRWMIENPINDSRSGCSCQLRDVV
jgi:hypothetical protein